LPTESNRKFNKYIKEFDEFIFDIIEEKRKVIKADKETEREDLLSNFLKLSEQDGIHFDKKGLRDEMVTFFVAGHDSKFESIFI
jgi:cytochrome P450